MPMIIISHRITEQHTHTHSLSLSFCLSQFDSIRFGSFGLSYTKCEHRTWITGYFIMLRNRYRVFNTSFCRRVYLCKHIIHIACYIVYIYTYIFLYMYLAFDSIDYACLCLYTMSAHSLTRSLVRNRSTFSAGLVRETISLFLYHHTQSNICITNVISIHSS